MEPHPGLDQAVIDDAAARAAGVPTESPIGDIGIGVIAPYDFALDRELWRWTPPEATLLLTRTPYSPLPVSVEQAEAIAEIDVIAACTTELIATQPEVIAYACTSGSFVLGSAGEHALTAAMFASGAPAAVSTSGALVRALKHLSVGRVAVATPYDEAITGKLVDYLAEAGVTVSGTSQLGLAGRIWRVPYATTLELARAAFGDGDCDAVFVSCTNLPSYDLIVPLEAELGVPVITANQVTIWAALQMAGLSAVGPGQRLLETDAGAAA